MGRGKKGRTIFWLIIEFVQFTIKNTSIDWIGTTFVGSLAIRSAPIHTPLSLRVLNRVRAEMEAHDTPIIRILFKVSLVATQIDPKQENEEETNIIPENDGQTKDLSSNSSRPFVGISVRESEVER